MKRMSIKQREKINEKRERILEEIIREITSNDLNSFKLTKNTRFGDLINSKTFSLVSKDKLKQFLDFHFIFEIQIDEITSTVSLIKKKRQINFEDEDIKKCLTFINRICNKDSLNLENCQDLSFENDNNTRQSISVFSKQGTILNNANNKNMTYNETGRTQVQSINKNPELIGSEERKDDSKYRTPLEFIYYMDEINDFNENKTKEEPKNLTETREEILTINVLKSEEKKCDLEGITSKSIKNINVFKLIENKDFCFIADSSGIITQFLYEDFTKVQTLENVKNLQKKNKLIENEAKCLDFFDGILVAGFSSGGIIVWENNFEENYYIIDDISQHPILCIKFLKVKNAKGKCEIIESDAGGNCNIIFKSKKLFSYTFKIKEPTLFKELEIPIKKIDVLNKDNESFNPSEFKYKNAKFVFGYENKKLITIMKLKPNSILYEMNKLNESELLYAFGKGLLPLPNQDGDDNDSTVYQLEITKISDIFILYNGDKVHLFYYVENHNYYQSYASYECNEPLLYIGFFPNSYVFLVGNEKIKILSTLDFKIRGEEEYNQSSNITFEDTNISDLELNKNDMFNNVKFENIFVMNKKIFIITDNIHSFKLLTWKKCIKSLKQNKKWNKVLLLGKEVLCQDSSMLLGETPEKAKSFNKKKSDLVVSLLNDFMNDIINEEVKSEESIEELIDFCISINNFDFLINQFHRALGLGKEEEKETIESSIASISDYVNESYTTAESNKKARKGIIEKNKEFYFACLEKMIFQEKFSSIQNIPELFIVDLIDYYLQSKKKILLCKLLLKFNYKCLQGNKVKELIFTNNLIEEIVYTIMNDENCDVYYPISFLLDLFKTKPESVNYESFITMPENSTFTEEMLNSKQYLGHRLLWYCDYVLNGKKYPNKGELIPYVYNIICVKLFIFLAKKVKTLVQFDSFTYFEIFKRFFIEDNLFKLINIDYKNGLKKEIQHFITKINFEAKDCNDIVNKIIEKCQNINNFYIMKDLYSFLGEVCLRGREIFSIDKAIIKQGINFLYKYPTEEISIPDPFCCHPRSGDPKFISSIEKNILTFFKYIENKLENDEIKELSIKFSISSYDAVEIFLYDLLKEYNANLNYQIDNILRQKPIDVQKKKNLFEWITQKLDDFKEKKDFSTYNGFINLILDRLYDLTTISLKDTCKIIDNYCSKRHKKVAINSLNNFPAMQLLYVETILENFTEGEEKEEDASFVYDDITVDNSFTSASSSVAAITYVNYEDFSALYIKLLCQMNEKDKIFELVKNNINLCNKKVLKILYDNKINDSAIYVNQTLGNYKAGHTLTLSEIENNYKNIIDNLNSEKFIRRKNIFLLQNHKKYLDLGIKTCQLLSEETYQEDSWLELLNKCYSIKEDLMPYLKKNKNNEKTYFYNKVEDEISSGIELILWKMCENVNVKLMVELVSEKCKIAGFKELRKILMDMFHSLTLLEIILGIVERIIGKEVIHNFEKLQMKIRKGDQMNISNCGICNKNLKQSENARIFLCGHIYHSKCCGYFIEKDKKENVCNICFKKDKSNFISEKEPIIPTEVKKEKKEENEEKENEEENEEEKMKEDDVKKNKLMKLQKRRRYFEEKYTYKQ